MLTSTTGAPGTDAPDVFSSFELISNVKLTIWKVFEGGPISALACAIPDDPYTSHVALLMEE